MLHGHQPPKSDYAAGHLQFAFVYFPTIFIAPLPTISFSVCLVRRYVERLSILADTSSAENERSNLLSVLLNCELFLCIREISREVNWNGRLM